LSVQCPHGTPYIVTRGDTLLTVALRFNIGIDTLVAANPQLGVSAQPVPGTSLCLPFPEPPPCTGGTLVPAQPGSTLFNLAQKYSIGIDAIIRANPQVTNPNNLFVGQPVCIPFWPRALG